MNLPDVSVVTATHERHVGLCRLLAALDRPTASSVELVVVDDASGDETPEILAAAITRHVTLRHLRLDRNLGPAAARNTGWRAARSSKILFTDDDCVPAPGWIDAMAGALDAVDVVQGRTEPDPDGLAQRGPFSHTVRIQRFTNRFETCNVGYRRTTLHAIGGFDESFRHPYGEDIDLGWRALASGAHAAFVDEALVHHDVSRSSYAGRLRQARRQEGIVQVVERHPNYRDELYHGAFVRPSHPAAIAALAGVTFAAASRRPWPTALGALTLGSYLHHRVRLEPLWGRRWWPVSIPGALVADLADVAVLARASLRHRTFVL